MQIIFEIVVYFLLRNVKIGDDGNGYVDDILGFRDRLRRI